IPKGAHFPAYEPGKLDERRIIIDNSISDPGRSGGPSRLWSSSEGERVMPSRRFWVWAAAVAVLTGAVALAGGLAASSSRDTKPQESKFAKGDPDSSSADKAGISNEGPSSTY